MYSTDRLEEVYKICSLPHELVPTFEMVELLLRGGKVQDGVELWSWLWSMRDVSSDDDVIMMTCVCINSLLLCVTTNTCAVSIYTLHCVSKKAAPHLNFENLLRFDRVTGVSLMLTFLRHSVVVINQ